MLWPLSGGVAGGAGATVGPPASQRQPAPPCSRLAGGPARHGIPSSRPSCSSVGLWRDAGCRGTGGQQQREQPTSTTALSSSGSSSSSSTGTAFMHPDANRRRAAALERRAARRREQEAMSKGTGWWELNAPPNLHTVTSPDHFSSTMETRLAAGQAVVVEFFAPWCRACRSLYPKLTQIASRNPDVQFVKFNVEPESLRELSEKMGVDRLPYFHFYKGNQGLVSHFTANLNPAQLQKLRTEISNLQKQ